MISEILHKKKYTDNTNQSEHSYHVIIVEDDLVLNQLIQMQLKNAGFMVEGATSGLEAIQLVQQYQDCILVLDYMLSDMNGKELIETLTAKQINITFVIMTANTEIHVVLDMMKLGAFDYIIKDSNLLDLIPPTVNKAMEHVKNKKMLTKSLNELHEGQKRFQELIELSPDAILVFYDTKIVYSNSQGIELFGVETLGQLIGKRYIDFVHPKYKERSRNILLQIENEKSKKPYYIHGVFHRYDGQVLDVDVKITSIIFNNQQSTLAFIRDLTERRLTEQSLDQSLYELRLLSNAVEKLTIGLMITDPNQEGHPIVYANPHFFHLTGYSPEEIIGHDAKILQGEDTDPLAIMKIREAIKNSEPISIEILNYRKDGLPFWNEMQLTPFYDFNGKLVHYISLQQDISERKQAENQIEIMAYHDDLTGLPNRRLFLDRLNIALNERIRDGHGLAVIMIDLDHFKIVNDSLGHYAGDIILQDLASRFRRHVSKNNTLARLGGDEFSLLLPSISSTEDVITACRQLQDVMNYPFHVEDKMYNLTLSIGISIYPEDGVDSTTLIKNADIAMYRSKAQGRNMYHWFTPSMNDMVIERVNLEASIRKCIANKNFILHYQPKINLKTGAIYGVEALIRMPSDENGLISPATFIPLAEETGLIVPIGEWVLETACKQNKAWQDEGFASMLISVNLSARQFQQGDLVQQVKQIIDDSGLDPKWLELELTESIIMSNIDEASEKLHQLKVMGIAISIDDFGTGFSSLSYLKNLPIDILKIDQSFITNIESDITNAAIARAIISLGHSLEMTVIAEGVETEEQLHFLRVEQCDSVQGYFFSVPCEADAFTQFLNKKKHWLKP